MANKEHDAETTKNSMEGITEEQFLKNLYLFMKKRDTPIERIPNLGFKQIDLYLMFKTVNDLGGYHQVTSHQLWKRVYNTLGGNPRSTSAATCTRRHYEKLLLPYECHLKGIIMSNLPHNQPRPYPYPKEEDGGQRPPKRKLPSLPLGPPFFQSDQLGSFYPLPLPYHSLYHPVLPPYVPIPSPVMPHHGPPAPKHPAFTFTPAHQDSTPMVTDPLKLLRSMAEQYKMSAGLSSSEPLNLSKKASAKESDPIPVSSFSPLASTKNPKFLNKPSTLYSPKHAGVMRCEGIEAQEGESSKGVPSFSDSEKKSKTDDDDIQVLTPSESPILISSLTPEPDLSAFVAKPKASSLKEDFPVEPTKDRCVRTEPAGFNFSYVLPRNSKEKDGKMEIEVPLSVFRNWLRLYGSSKKLPETKELLVSDSEESLGNTSLLGEDILPTDMTFCRPQNQSLAEDLRLRNKSNLVPNTETENYKDSSLTSSKTSDGLLTRGEADQGIWSFKPRARDFWNAHSKETVAPQNPIKPGSSPTGIRTNSTFYMEDMMQRGMQRLEVEPSAVLMVNSSTATRIPLTPEEVMKLQNIMASA
ncbi:PREDICTED: uncharacterized protein LOC107094650 [Cyprinodon variegatus]|uniref:AT-rich interaction domain 6 n=1 Tax=Cyprinodon variegatus TaxID=28743 RepID=A0A3Q2FDG9_CYPVA|nr:PREDICTED: uncharacterized protein LOC107094650 [Cyprinodon variegatus]